MTLILPTGYAQINLQFGGTALPRGAEMTFAVDNNPANSPAVIGAFVSAAWVTHLKSVFLAVVSLDNIHVKVGPTATGPTADVAGPGAGSLSGNALAPNTAVLVQKLTAFGGKAGKGRMYHPGVGDSWANNAGVLDPTTVADIQGAYDDFLGELTGGGYDMVLLHSSTTYFANPTVVTGLAVETQVATQRRRNRK